MEVTGTCSVKCITQDIEEIEKYRVKKLSLVNALRGITGYYITQFLFFIRVKYCETSVGFLLH